MAQAGYTPISLYYSTTAAAVPTTGNLANGELGLNIADMKLYAKNSAGTVTLLASSGGAAGTVSSVAVSGGTTGLTTSGGPITTSGTITLAGTLATANGGTNLTSFTSGGVVYASSSSALATGSALTFDGTNVTNALGGSYYAANSSYGFGTPDSAGLQIFTASGNAIRLGTRATGTFTELARLDATGLGIGTNSPLTKLQVNAAAPTIRIEETTTGGSKRLEMGVTSGGQAFIGANQSAQTLQLQTLGSTRFEIGASGQFGIGGATYGTAGQVLTSGGSGAAPTWAAAAGGGSQAFVAFGSTGGL